jgi:cell division protein FtsA
MAASEIITGLDIGTTKISAIIAELEDGSLPKIIGVGTVPSEGLRKGIVINMEKTVVSIENALDIAEKMSGVRINEVYVGIAGDHIRSYNGKGVVAIAGDNNEINEDDIRRAIDAAKAVVIPIDREVIHVIPLEFTIDEQKGIKDPMGMSGMRLETEVHIVTGAITSAQNIYRCVERAGVRVRDLVLEPLASSYSVLSDAEKDLGVVVVDIGGGTTDIAMFYEGAIRNTSVVALGGHSVTSDLARCLRTSPEEAEKIKIAHGSAFRLDVEDKDRVIEIPSVDGSSRKKAAKELVIDIVEPRMEEMLRLALSEIRKSEFAGMMTSGVVLTGGASMLHGAIRLAEEIFDMPVKSGIPHGFTGLIDLVKSPIYATGIGLILYADRHRFELEAMLDEDQGPNPFEKIWERMKRWFS